MGEKFEIITEQGESRYIELECGDLESLELHADLLVCSAFKGNYAPVSRTLIGSLARNYHISVESLARAPALDLQDFGVWISSPLSGQPFRRLACVEMRNRQEPLQELFETLFFAISQANRRGISVESVALPLLGTGNQGFREASIAMPLVTECVNALTKSNSRLKRIVFFERSQEKYRLLSSIFADCLKKVRNKMAFISYSHEDQEIANRIADCLEQQGVKVWIDHKKIRNPNYGEEIVQAIQSADAFVILVSTQSQNSKDVLRELRNAANCEENPSLALYPLLLEKVKYSDTFKYYLTGLNYSSLSTPPQSQEIDAFIGKILGDLATQ